MGSRGKEEQQRVKALLADTVTLLCKNGLSFKKNLKVQGLLGVTVDDDEVFIVHLNETMGDLVSASDPDQTEIQSPSKQGQSGRRSPKRKRRRRSTDSNKSKEQEEECIDLDPDIEIKTEPDMLVVDELKYEGTPSKQSCRYPDEGLNFAIGSISSQNISFPGGTGDTGGGGAPPNTADRFNPLNTSATDSVTTSTGHQPFVTGMIPNVADTSNQSSADGSFQWDSHAAQGVPGMSNWASQLAQQTMSQSDMSQQPGPSQGYSPAQRTGTETVDIKMEAVEMKQEIHPETQGTNPEKVGTNPGKMGTNPNIRNKNPATVNRKPCPKCLQVAKLSKIDMDRRQCKQQGLPYNEWPMLHEPTLESNPDCSVCFTKASMAKMKLHRVRRARCKQCKEGDPKKKQYD